MKETYRRTVAKTITYRASVMLTSFVVLWLLTNSIDVAIAFTGLSLVYSTIIYFIHERAWLKVKWGAE